MVQISSLGGSSPMVPEMAPLGAHAAGLQSQYNIEEDDLDELVADDSIPCSSPYFTQPTQIIDRETQPTQIVEKRTTLYKKSSSPIPETPNKSAVEVPASSPFQARSGPSTLYGSSDKPVQRPAVKTEDRIGAKQGGRLASFMAPAGTAFRAPIAPPRLPEFSVKPETSDDDDLVKDYKRRQDSSDDDAPMKGEIRPTSFIRKPTSVARPTTGIAVKPSIEADITLNDIKDIRLRYLTKETRKIVVKTKPYISVLACKNAVIRNNMSAEDAVNELIGKIQGAVSQSNNSDPTSIGASGAILNNSRQTNLYPVNLSSPPSSPSSPFVQKAGPRRRLVQGRKNRSPTPPPVFSVSSSHSSPATTPSSSAEIIERRRPSKMAVASTLRPGADAQPQPRRRLANGSRARSTAREVIVLDDSDSEDEFPDLDTLASRKRKATTDLREAPAPIEIGSDSEDEIAADWVNSDSGSEPSGSQRKRADDRTNDVLEYLNRCTAEELARITNQPIADTKLVVLERPFDSFEAVEKVSRRQKGKRKSSKVEIGSTILESLMTWHKALKAATTVIHECARRGKEIQDEMAAWGMDKNGQIKDPEALDLPITKRPALMDESVQLKPYQLLGLNWLNLIHNFGYSGILADDMGLGKTCQVISFISHIVATGKNWPRKPWPNLIVVPPSTFENWVNEFEKFAPELSIALYTGPNRKEQEPGELQDTHVVLTTYSQIDRSYEDIAWLRALDPYAAIFDEGHKLKNPLTKVYQHLKQVPAEWRLVLSGTPVQNNLKELLSLLNFVEPDLFQADTFEDLQTIFKAKVVNRDVHNFAILAKERVGNARTIMAPFILQRRKDEVLDLAKKTEMLALVEMHPEQKAIYDEEKGTYLVEGKKKSTKGNPWMQLRKAAIHHQLFRRHFKDKKIDKMTDILWNRCSAEELYVQSKADKHKEMFRRDLMEKSDFELHLYCRDYNKYIGKFDIPHRSWEDSPKVQKLLELVRGYQKTGDRCLVFSRFEMVINILRETFCHADIPYCELTGVSRVSDRYPEIQKFNDNVNIPVFLLTTGAGGTGLNLTAANKIIIFDQSDNPQDDIQASNRAHRIGQTRDVEVIRIVTEKSVEVLVYNSCVKKLMLAACVEGQVDDEDDESVEEECRKKMLLDTDADVHASQAIDACLSNPAILI